MLNAAPVAAAAVIEHASSVIEPLNDRLWAAATDVDLVEAAGALVDLEAKTAAVRAQVLAEISAREIPRKQLQWASTTEWWAHLAGVTAREARRTVKTAPVLVGERDATLEALAAGTVSGAQAELIVRTIDGFPLDPALRERGERALLAEAANLDATQLGKTAAVLLERVDPDKADRKAEADLDREERAAHLNRDLSITEDGAGGIRIRGRGSVEDAAVLRAALLPLTKPTPAVDPDDPEGPERDVREHGTRMWDALVQVAQHALDTDLPPASHGARPRVTVIVRLDDLREEHRDAYRPSELPVTEDGLDLTPEVARRAACDADVIPVVLGSDGQVLDVGRSQRLVTFALWIALITRDRHCAFPGCTRPPLMCHAHHIEHWADGGSTALHNLVLLCGQHHRVVHDTPWQVRLNSADGRPEFLPPPRRRDNPPQQAWTRHRPRRE